MLLPDPPSQYDAAYFRELLQQIEKRLPEQTTSTALRVYTVKNFTETLTLDLDTATQADINNFLATIANDIYQRGLLP